MSDKESDKETVQRPPRKNRTELNVDRSYSDVLKNIETMMGVIMEMLESAVNVEGNTSDEGSYDFAKSEATGQTTVNKKAPIHYIIPINDMVHRPF